MKEPQAQFAKPPRPDQRPTVLCLSSDSAFFDSMRQLCTAPRTSRAALMQFSKIFDAAIKRPERENGNVHLS